LNEGGSVAPGGKTESELSIGKTGRGLGEVQKKGNCKGGNGGEKGDKVN